MVFQDVPLKVIEALEVRPSVGLITQVAEVDENEEFVTREVESESFDTGQLCSLNMSLRSCRGI